MIIATCRILDIPNMLNNMLNHNMLINVKW
jgi:hypothetical protein